MSEIRRVLVTGATGLIGRTLCRQLAEDGYQVAVLSRSPEAARRSVPQASAYYAWAPDQAGDWQAAIDSAYGVIHLAGAPIAARRWSATYKQEIINSRVNGTRSIVSAIEQARTRPAVLVCASGIDYYGDRGDTPIDESAAPGQ